MSAAAAMSGGNRRRARQFLRNEDREARELASRGAGAERWTVLGLRLALGIVFLAIGLQKLTPYEAEAIRPFAARSPFLAWAYGLAGARGASVLFAAVEIPTGLGLVWGVARPGSAFARWAALMAAATAFVSFSFLATSSGAVIWRGGFPLLTLSVGQLFFKDLALVAAALVVAADDLSARR